MSGNDAEPECSHRDVEHTSASAQDQQCRRGLEFLTKEHCRKRTDRRISTGTEIKRRNGNAILETEIEGTRRAWSRTKRDMHESGW